MNQQLDDYVKRSRQSGKKDEQIRQELLGSGWQIGDVEESLKINLVPNKTFKFPIFILLVLGIAIVGYFSSAYYFTLWPFETPVALIPTYTPESSSLSPVPTAIKHIKCSSPDHLTYLQIQDLMQRTQYSKPEVIENSLCSFDIDSDGDQDVLGFLKLTFDYDSNYLFSTWHRTQTGFDYYEDSYYDFRLSEKNDHGLTCSIADLAVGSITLSCAGLGGQEYLVTLRYQKIGVGYYRDVDAHVITFHNDNNWPEYISKKGGIRFNYSPDIQISEKTYEIYEDLITIITGKRNNQTLFEIKTVPQKDDWGGGVIGLAQKTIFIKLSDGTYLSRNWLGGKSDSQESGIFYDRANAYVENNSGAIGETNDAANISKGRRYTIFSAVTMENGLRETDNIFASIKYVETPAIRDEGTIVLQNKTISLANFVTLQVPGQVTERQSTENGPGTIEGKDLEITFIVSPIYQPSSLNLELHPFGSIGDTNAIGGGGYDADKNRCFGFEKDDLTAPEKIGENYVCRFGYGDAGFSSQGYYVLDPTRKYILNITQEGMYDPFYETLDPKMEDIVKSVHFSK
jgi:hypothetical protein